MLVGTWVNGVGWNVGRPLNKLTAVKVAALNRPGRYGDGGGLWLQVGPTGGKSWAFRYQLDGRVRQAGLGAADLFTLAEARDRAREFRRLLADGIDPIEAREEKRRTARAARANIVTFKAAAEKYIAAHRPGWKNAKHGDQWEATLSTHAFPKIGDRDVAEIGTADILGVLEPIWPTKTETASRVRGRIERILDWAKVRGHRTGENPARWRGHLDKLLPARRKVRPVRPQPAMAYADVPAFVTRLRTVQGISARALEFTILTAVRTGETIGAAWPEIDLAAALWTIPAVRMKGGREHKVPLAERAIEILADLPRERGNDHVFIGARKGRGLSSMAMLETLREFESGLTVHGFRSSFRDWAAERTAYPNHVAEMALAHRIADATEAAYRRGELLDKRRRLMRDWARFVGMPATDAAVAPLRARR